MKHLISFLFVCLAGANTVAQNNVSFKINPKTVTKGQSFEIEVLATGLTDIITLDFSVRWDSTMLKFEEVSGLNSELSTMIVNSNNALSGSGYVTAGWFSVNPKNLPPNSIIFKLRLKALVTGSTPVAVSASPQNVNVINGSFVSLPYTITSGQITILQTSSTSEQELHQARVFPNPCNDFIQLDLRGQNEETGDISILDASGRLVRRITPAKGVNHESDHTLLLNTSELSPGNYWLKYNDGSQTATVPFVRQ
jgi:hypothetical protein